MTKRLQLGTKITTLFRYTSQSSIVQILCYIIIYFVYGWQTIESDILTTTNEPSSVSLLVYLTRPTSPLYTVLMFTLVPALLCTKFTAVFDLLLRGNDVLQHIDAGTCFIPGPVWMRRIIGYVCHEKGQNTSAINPGKRFHVVSSRDFEETASSDE
ncbi:hypothetical protein ANCDUO_06300 [Ancylostoma duodenale]|uniref:Uncharacterized protein n=1 Tax=Ancylostoma duodenale TaxID=51022 RepID=A0A0C2GWI1_9BILA|nr:hypothetical protein ANCDUO_06300 [Ancylostoma duodenale]